MSWARKIAGSGLFVAPIIAATILVASSPRPIEASASPTPSFAPVATPKIIEPIDPVDIHGNVIAPVYGSVRLGAFAGEAARLAGLSVLSTFGLGDPANYEKYRTSIRQCYGVDLEDMNYFSLEQRNFDERLSMLEKWIMMAGHYGDVTIALEPLGKERYDIFKNDAVMEKLRQVFLRAKEHDIRIWIRFASESNLPGSEYSAIKDEAGALRFYDSAVAFKKKMPDNVKLVFSPLINTFYLGRYLQLPLANEMFLGRGTKNTLWDRVGGTIYRTTLPLASTYTFYYEYMSKLDPDVPFQVCEVGGPYSRRDELMAFLDSCGNGKWPKLVKVNLFARDINSRADPDSQFGFLEPSERARKWAKAEKTGQPEIMESWLKPKLRARAAR